MTLRRHVFYFMVVSFIVFAAYGLSVYVCCHCWRVTLCLRHIFDGSFFRLILFILFCGNVSWVMVQNFLAQSVRVYVCINLGCAYALVSEHALYGAQVGSAFKQGGGKAVAQCVRTYRLLYACLGTQPLYHYQNHGAGEVCASAVQKT